MRTAVLGHVEWIDFVRVDDIPASGDIIHAREAWEEPGGGGSVAAVQLAKLAGACSFYTALGDDERGRRARDELSAVGVDVHATVRAGMPQRRAITFVEDAGERTITVLGDRLGPRAGDPLPWDDLAAIDAVYVCAADPEAIRLARRARIVVATSRILPDLRAAGVRLDALVGSATDPSETYADGDLEPRPDLVVRTAGAAGGTFHVGSQAARRYAPASVPGPTVDTYGAGDSFAAALAFALAAGHGPTDAVGIAARAGAAVLAGRGPYEGQIRTT